MIYIFVSYYLCFTVNVINLVGSSSLGTCLEQQLCVTAENCCQCVHGSSLLSGIIEYGLPVILQCWVTVVLSHLANADTLLRHRALFMHAYVSSLIVCWRFTLFCCCCCFFDKRCIECIKKHPTTDRLHYMHLTAFNSISNYVNSPQALSDNASWVLWCCSVMSNNASFQKGRNTRIHYYTVHSNSQTSGLALNGSL